METTLGKRIAFLRKKKELKQEKLSEMLAVSPQAVSKWENAQSCPDINLLPGLAEILGVTVDELLSGKQEEKPLVTLLPESERKDIKNMVLRIIVESDDGDKVKMNLPMALIQLAVHAKIAMPLIAENPALKEIDWSQILDMVRQGWVGNLVEVESDDGDTVKIFVE